MDHRAVLRDPLPSVSALPLEENIFVWHANLYGGAEGSPYHGGIFHFELVFPQDYPSNPPYARLLTELPHPHVINDRICMDILADYQGFFDTDVATHPSHPSFIGWTAAYGVQSILVQLQAFLLGMEDSAGQAERLQACLKRIPNAVERSRKFVWCDTFSSSTFLPHFFFSAQNAHTTRPIQSGHRFHASALFHSLSQRQRCCCSLSLFSLYRS